MFWGLWRGFGGSEGTGIFEGGSLTCFWVSPLTLPPCAPPEEPKDDKSHPEDDAGTPPPTTTPSPPQKPKEGVPGAAPGGVPDPKPRPLHKTCSLFMRNIAPNIAQAEIVAVRGGPGGLGGAFGVPGRG